MGRYVIEQRMADLLRSASYSLKHEVTAGSERLTLTNLDEGWSERVIAAVRKDAIPGDPPLVLYELLLDRITQRNIARMRRILDGKEK